MNDHGANKGKKSMTSFFNWSQQIHNQHGNETIAFENLEEESTSGWFKSYLVTVMGLVIPWSIILVLVDAYSVFVKGLAHQHRIQLVVIIGDCVLSFLSLAAACSTASVTDLLRDVGSSYCLPKLCSRYQMSAAMAFLCWFLSFASSLFNLWLLPSL